MKAAKGIDGEWAGFQQNLLAQAAAASSLEAFLRKAMPDVIEGLGAEGGGVLRPEQGMWRRPTWYGTEIPPPEDLLGDVLDSDRFAARGDWSVAPLGTAPPTSEVLAVYHPLPDRTEMTGAVESTAGLLSEAMAIVRRHEAQARRIQRLEALIQVTGSWNRELELEALLNEMAEASTKLLEAERASIFLWDKPNKTLVGRPALGVEGGELRVPDDRGIVGQVVQTGETRRVSPNESHHEINRAVDQQLEFQTRSLLCVPLVGRSGKRFGAFEMINKRSGSFTDEDEEALIELSAHAAVALENSQQYQQLVNSRKQMASEAAHRVQLIGDSAAIQALQSTIRRVADTELAILVLGENGTGKEVVSQLIHYLSRRRDEPMVAVNCAALTQTLLESELFGHEKGAFTGAHESRAGKFEAASGGTLFLDEIGDLSLGGQAKLLRVLEEKVVVRVGGTTPIHTDARVIAATNQDLAGMVRSGDFREDLFFRLNVVTLDLPPLRDRGEDVLLLAEHFINTFSAQARRTPPKLTAAARRRLVSHPWPGNVRELRNLMERLVYLSPEDKVDAGDLAFILTPNEEQSTHVSLDQELSEATTRFQIDYIERQINAARGNMTEAAKRLGLHRSNLYRKMRQLGMKGKDEGE